MQRIILLFFLVSLSSLHAETFGIFSVKFEEENAQATFTLRHGVLIYEKTLFLPSRGAMTQTWTERFFHNGREVFLRSGVYGAVNSEHVQLAPYVRVARSPDRLYIGDEIFTLGENGFFHVIADKQSLLKSSVIRDPIFFNQKLDQKRKEFLEFTAPIPNR